MILELLKHAAIYAKKREDRRTFFVGAIAIRKDGVMVKARNEATHEPMPACHAEARVCKKIDVGSTVFVARAMANGCLALAKPCKRCQAILRSHKVNKVHYSVSDTEYGTLYLQ